MNLRQMLSNDVMDQIADEPIDFTFDASVYIGAWSGLNFQRPLEIGGFDPQPTAVLVTPLLDRGGNALFVVRPTVGDRVVIRGRPFRIRRTETDPTESCLQMDLEDV